jgi:GWxTD domain-containing protein
MKSFIYILLALTIFVNISIAQLNYIPLNADYACFKGSNNNTYTEFYLSFFQQDLKYEQNDSSYVSKFLHTLKISNEDSVVFTTTRNYRNSILSLKGNISSKFVEVFPVELSAGDYTASATIHDKISNKSGEYLLNFTIPDYNLELLASKIQLANSIDSKGDDSNYSLKNNIKILPNASKTYTIVNPILYFYFEGYNLTLKEDGTSNYTYSYYISDMDGRKIREYPEKEKSSNSSSIAEATGLNVIALNSAPYYLNVIFKDASTDISTLTRKKFFVNKPSRQRSVQDIAAKIEGYEEYAGMTKQQLLNEFNIVKYIALSEEVDIFEKMTDEEGMKRFLSQFWKRRDHDPETPANENKQIFFENLRIANANYSTHFKEGWRTDRGRVVLIYGRPDEIERNASTLDSQPYEIWHFYSLEGGTQFVFADISGNGSYELLHSTYRNEIKDPDWRMRVEKLKNRDYNSGFDNF